MLRVRHRPGESSGRGTSASTLFCAPECGDAKAPHPPVRASRHRGGRRSPGDQTRSAPPGATGSRSPLRGRRHVPRGPRGNARRAGRVGGRRGDWFARHWLPPRRAARRRGLGPQHLGGAGRPRCDRAGPRARALRRVGRGLGRRGADEPLRRRARHRSAPDRRLVQPRLRRAAPACHPARAGAGVAPLPGYRDLDPPRGAGGHSGPRSSSISCCRSTLPRHRCSRGCQTDPWRTSSPSSESDLLDERYTTFVAEHDGRVIGTAIACSVEMSSMHAGLARPVDAGFLGYVAVLPEARGAGAGRALGERVLAWARDAGYGWVVTDWRSANIEADRAWRSLGFEPLFRRLHRSIS